MKNEIYEDTYKNKKHFSFGKNWQNFLKTLTDEKIQEAKKSLVEFLGGEDKIKDKTFVDIGSGSGLFSLAAYLLGAKEVVSVDVDDFSIACAKYLKEKNGNPENWKITKGSALDENFIKTLGQFDIVYSWGVLHHTGEMYRAFENVIQLMKTEGVFYLAIYNKNTKCILEGTSKLWVNLKRFYNSSNVAIKKIMECVYVTYFVIGLVANLKNPFSYIKNYSTLRGMNFFTDIKDWLGGYPYEYASVKEIIVYFKKYNMICEKYTGVRSIGCNEFLLKKL
ncbi:MAG: class I SAM-dependent methyltransferase [Parcubacteria group bacterium]|jgi:2-polyprenyl-6-hydroxyphenyl methylase/3-demethylubiquinone-9 3-methyltransferase